MRILLIDNFDSFTYNLVHYLEEFEVEVRVVRNNLLEWEMLENIDGVVISPGPGLPEEAGLLLKFLENLPSFPVLGVCLGCQALAVATQGKLRNLDKVLHGVATVGEVVDAGVLFKNLPKHFQIGHYHSWVVDEKSLSVDWKVTMLSSDHAIMAMEHQSYPWFGIQFHPESVLTERGKEIIKNWLSYLSNLK